VPLIVVGYMELMLESKISSPKGSRRVCHSKWPFAALETLPPAILTHGTASEAAGTTISMLHNALCTVLFWVFLDAI
jgi:hypothetical protein